MLHIYSSSKIAFILIFRNEMKSRVKISFFLLSLARNKGTAKVVTRLKTFYFTEKKLK